jgi:NADH dehydrogenase
VLVLAAGSRTNFFGNESIRKNALSLKGIDDALYMRNELIKTLEAASLQNDPAQRAKLLTLVVAGGGPTGVEMAGMLAKLKKHIIVCFSFKSNLVWAYPFTRCARLLQD